MLDKTYDPAAAETAIYRAWEAGGAFACGRRGNATPYTIVIPPPNVTGSLHMGHALNNTLQDILIRYRRMRGDDALWQPGTDHAGIATQMVVERQLAEKKIRRQDLGREGFVETVWKWKAESGGTIVNQLRRLGASCDWGRERFTMDDGLSLAVRKVFVDLYRDGLIYKDKRLVNWDCGLQTAISDLEVEAREIKGKLWHFKYPIEGAPEDFIVIATTRPETMLGDSGVAVHPEDERWRRLVGKRAVLPLVGRRIPIVADDYSDPTKGTGAVKITPAHDFNDFEVGKRHNLEQINVLEPSGRIGIAAPEAFRGLDRFEARKRVVAEMEALGLVAKVEDHVHVVPHGDRSGTPIEPFLTDQWYVDAKTLAREAIEAVEDGRTVFVPKQYENVYFEWMRNIQPWCVSRQLWWGHRIPAWYGPDGKAFVAMTEAEAAADAARHYGKPVALERDEDVLDTWFSSALWPFSTLGWPERTKELERYYPTDTLVTGFDIIFFWVARMMMMGLHFMKQVPFRTVYVHALVRDAKGQKMSKSKGNIVDPLDLIDKFGADALRFTLASQAAQGRDVKLAESRVEGNRNFVTKLWNASRFCEMNGCKPDMPMPEKSRLAVNRWIRGALARAAADCQAALDAYRFNEAANGLYQFTWGTFCDWYLEFIKPVLGGGNAAAKAETQAVAAAVLGDLLRLLHPFIPFVTEGLWQRLVYKSEGPLMLGAWPTHATPADDGAGAEMDWVVRLISAVRAARAEMNVPAAAKLNLRLRGADAATAARLAAHQEEILRLARLESAQVGEAPAEKGDMQIVLDGAVLILPLAGHVDLAKESARLAREIDKADGEIAKIDQKLGNQAFVAKAPEEVIEEQRERRAQAELARAKLREALARIAV
ncbi:MAG: valine--tRNA ligase [Alphaproteobacteria bacterium]|nr:valine--tRNA ligase [Alphaproteobacteria bacterium]